MALTAEQLCRLYSLADIQLATENFNDGLVIGHGGFGKVYKGQINGEEDVVAIKRLNSMSDQGASEFRAEIDVLSKLRHAHLVSLLGCCNDGKEMILVYEYMPNGTLYHHLHKSNAPLSWMQRLRIGIGAARGLDYLHTGVGTKHGIIHRDVKSSNILLDEDWAAKISDFVLAKLCPINQSSTYIHTAGIKGTFGYLDPEIFMTGKFTRKSDVFAFGVVLFELLSGRHAVLPENDEDLSLARWAQKCVKERKLDQIVAAEIKGTLSTKSLKEFVQIGYRCLHSDPKERPTMSEVVATLQLSLALQEKFESCAKPAGLFGLTWMMLGYTFPPKKESSGKVTSSSVPPSPPIQADILHSGVLKPFSFSALKLATRNFRHDSILGEGEMGVIFKGWIDEQSLAAAKPGTGTVIAVKRLSRLGHREWLSDINYSGLLNHPNLVKLIGYCLEDDHRLLVYEYIPRGSLGNHLFRKSSYFQPLTWNLRIKVSLGAAKGLAYLHSLEEKLICGKFKTSNILIDSNYNAKLSDFGLAKDKMSDFGLAEDRPVSHGEGYECIGDVRTYEGEAPEYIATGHFDAMSDVYSFGVVLLEILTGRRCVDRNRPRAEQILVEFSKSYLTSKRRILQIMDPRIAGQYSPNVAMRAATLATKCLLNEPECRPTADEVVKALEQLQELQKAYDISRKELIGDGKPVSYPIPAGSGSGAGSVSSNGNS